MHSVDEPKLQKLNQLQRLLPEGLLADAAWLETRGYSRGLRSYYVKAGWLEQPARGVFRRPGGSLRWDHVVASMQSLLGLPVVVGGRTALELQGFAHYLSAAEPREVHIYADCPMPAWLDALGLGIQFIRHNDRKLFGNASIARGLTRVELESPTGFAASSDPIHNPFIELDLLRSDRVLTVSSPERAALELAEEVPARETFHQADVLFESMHTLSPRRLQSLLEDCRSIKAKRLLLWFAERHDLAWLRRIDRERVNLGSGKRMLVRGGKLDAKYLITVPSDLHGHDRTV